MLLKKTVFSNASMRWSSCHITNTFLASSILNTSWVRWQVIRPSFSSAIFCKACSTPHRQYTHTSKASTGKHHTQVCTLTENNSSYPYHTIITTHATVPPLMSSSHHPLHCHIVPSCSQHTFHAHTHTLTHTSHVYAHMHIHTHHFHSSTHQGDLIWHFILHSFVWNLN